MLYAGDFFSYCVSKTAPVISGQHHAVLFVQSVFISYLINRGVGVGGGGEIFRPTGAHTASYKMGTRSFSGVKGPGAWR
jgi:hypothetical protein